MRRPISALVDIEKTLNRRHGSQNVKTLISFLIAESNGDSYATMDEIKAWLNYKWDVLRQYPEVIQWIKDNGLEPK